MEWSRDVGGVVLALYQTSACQPSSFHCSRAAECVSVLRRHFQKHHRHEGLSWKAGGEAWSEGAFPALPLVNQGSSSDTGTALLGKLGGPPRLVTRMWAKSSTSVKSFWCSSAYPLDFCWHNTTDLGPGLFADLTNNTSLTKGPGGRAICSRLWFGDRQHIAWVRGSSVQESRAYWRQFLISF